MLIQLQAQPAKTTPRNVFYSYSHRDEALRDELDTHLKLLRREGFISTWHDRRIRPGDEWDHVINDQLNSADIIFFLVSPDFLASDYCRDIEVRRAMERYESGDAVVVPIILRPCVWTREAFARLQALPRNGRPLVEWRETGFARVCEEIRTLIVDLLHPRKPLAEGDATHGNWIIKMRADAAGDDQERSARVVARLREFCDDFSITLEATSTTQIVNGERLERGLMLILNGEGESFSKLSKAQNEGRLASEVDDAIISLYMVHGASVKGESSVGDSSDVGRAHDDELLLRPGRSMQASFLKGVIVPREEDRSLHFIINRGDTSFADEQAKRADYQLLSDYFYSSFVVKDELQWVNLSAYEANRMLPPELSGTQMGRNLLSQDCMLKRLTASLMHPDCETGREYWDAVYAEARRRFGTSKLPLSAFQKVWIVPVEASIYENSEGQTPPDDFPLKVPLGASFAYVLKNVLDVQCEEDLVAKSHQDRSARNFEDGDFTLAIFREIVLPKLRQEVNEGEHFVEIRRIYSAMILAAWLKRCAHKITNRKIAGLADSGKTTTRFVIGDITPVNSMPTAPSSPQAQQCSAPIDHATPGAAAFNVPENVEFYREYVRLFKNGVFRCARSEQGDAEGESVIRVYFSGGINFCALSALLRIPLHMPVRHM